MEDTVVLSVIDGLIADGPTSPSSWGLRGDGGTGGGSMGPVRVTGDLGYGFANPYASAAAACLLLEVDVLSFFVGSWFQMVGPLQMEGVQRQT
jgi:hypothetical protein